MAIIGSAKQRLSAAPCRAGERHEPVLDHPNDRETLAGATGDHLRWRAPFLWRFRGSGGAYRWLTAHPSWPETRRAHRHRHGELRRDPARDLRRVAGRHDRGADELQAASARDGVDPEELGGAILRGDAGAGREDGGDHRRDVAADRRDRDARLQGAAVSRRNQGYAGRSGRCRLAVLHERHHRPAEGRAADSSQPAGDGLRLLLRRRNGRSGRHLSACRAALSWVRYVGAGLSQPRRSQRRAAGLVRSRPRL